MRSLAPLSLLYAHISMSILSKNVSPPQPLSFLLRDKALQQQGGRKGITKERNAQRLQGQDSRDKQGECGSQSSTLPYGPQRIPGGPSGEDRVTIGSMNGK